MASATMNRRGNRFAAGAVIAAVAVTAGSLFSPAVAPAQAADRVVLFTTSGTHEVVVPAGATSVRVVAQGGSGASSSLKLPGAGARVEAELQVVAGETLTATVGGNAIAETGGVNGGADGRNPAAVHARPAGGGGGATDLRRLGTGLADRVLVAGGGGGASPYDGTSGGTASGSVGGAGITRGNCVGDAGGGTLTSGGAPGAPCDSTVGEAGSLGIGGLPGFRDPDASHGGGGGGGFFGGGGGSPYGGGGAGSSYVDPAGTNVSMTAGVLYEAPFIRLTFRMPPATGMSLALSQSSVVADGASTFTATATMRDSEARPVTGETVIFSSTDAAQQIGATTDHGDGTYSASITPSTTVGNVTVIASSGALAATRTMVQTVGPPASVVFLNAPVSGPADGTASLPVSFAALDAQGRYVVPNVVQIASSDLGHRFAGFTMPLPGIYTGTLIVSTRAGVSTVTVSIPSTSPRVESSFSLTQTPGAADSLEVALASSQLVADGAASTTLSITSADQYDNPLSAQPLSVTSSDPGVGLGVLQNLGDGNYAVDVTSSTQAGDVTLTVTDASVTPALVRTVTFAQAAGAPEGAQLTLGTPWLTADGTGETTLVATVLDEFGNPVTDLPIGATSTDPGHRFSPAVETSDGVYEVRVRASRTVGTSTLSLGLIGAPAVNRLAAPLQAITLAVPQIQEEAPTPLAEVLGTTQLEQRAGAVVPGKDPAPAAKPAALAGTGSESTLGGWAATALLMAGGVLLLSRRKLRRG
ncbi:MULTISPECIES: invasin domain 3-containing protein [unclassified Leucobacter]|uniref:invasin domain 3-containing protein n=1 Tax=unclassified Leucobacter TaxID=2621730 RepID=UPI00165E2D28|nr:MULTISPECIES: invasin domain 3-containing protein [unclassified Leucobacter]MBC9936046.1 hypothetical protein [Leucobacter sp. cx-87]